MIIPDTDIILLKVPLELSSEHQITFANLEAQYNYFYNLPKRQDDDATYLRKDGVIRFPALMDDIQEYNYVMYRNYAFTDKWFYAYIDSMEFLNPNTTAIKIKTDVFQTWQFDFQYKPSFIEREHVNNDTIGLHTVPENLETGELIINGSVVEHNLGSGTSKRIIVGLSDTDPLTFPESPPGVTGFQDIRIYSGVTSGLIYVVLSGDQDVAELVKAYDNAGKADAIYTIFLAPLTLIPNTDITWQTQGFGNVSLGFIASSRQAVNLGTFTANRPATVDGYTPKNNKLLTYPYSYCYLSNNVGGNVEYRWEDFTSGQASFSTYGAISSGCSIKTVPNNYKKQTQAFDFGLIGGKLPLCGWNSDAYTNWLTQNGLNLAWQSAKGVAGAVLGGAMTAATGSSVLLGGYNLSAIATGLSAAESIGDALVSMEQHSIMPDQARGNTNTGDVVFASGHCGYSLYPMSVRYEFAKIIDNYFSAYGYRINDTKVPNITGRTNWNYVKTIGAYVTGDIPQEDMAEYKKLLDTGITFWHNPATFLDYSQNNNILT